MKKDKVKGQGLAYQMGVGRTPESEKEFRDFSQALVDNLNRNVLAEHGEQSGETVPDSEEGE